MDLVDQIGLLDDLLLTSVTTEFPDALTEVEKASVSAYLVLGHACIEEYLEDAFVTHFAMLINWLVSPVVPRATAALLSAIGMQIDGDKVAFKDRHLNHAVGLGRVRYDAIVKANHGIKSANLKKLVAGVGHEWTLFEQRFNAELADLDTLGSKRGEAGHLSPFSGKAVVLTPKVYPDDVRVWMSNGRDAALAIRLHLQRRVQDQIGGGLATLGLE